MKAPLTTLYCFRNLVGGDLPFSLLLKYYSSMLIDLQNAFWGQIAQLWDNQLRDNQLVT